MQTFVAPRSSAVGTLYAASNVPLGRMATLPPPLKSLAANRNGFNSGCGESLVTEDVLADAPPLKAVATHNVLAVMTSRALRSGREIMAYPDFWWCDPAQHWHPGRYSRANRLGILTNAQGARRLACSRRAPRSPVRRAIAPRLRVFQWLETVPSTADPATT